MPRFVLQGNEKSQRLAWCVLKGFKVGPVPVIKKPLTRQHVIKSRDSTVRNPGFAEGAFVGGREEQSIPFRTSSLERHFGLRVCSSGTVLIQF